MRFAPVIIALGLAACSPGKDAEEQYRMVEKAGGSKQELCDAAGKVADAYLSSKDQENYERWKLTRDIQCMSAR